MQDVLQPCQGCQHGTARRLSSRWVTCHRRWVGVQLPAASSQKSSSSVACSLWHQRSQRLSPVTEYNCSSPPAHTPHLDTVTTGQAMTTQNQRVQLLWTLQDVDCNTPKGWTGRRGGVRLQGGREEQKKKAVFARCGEGKTREQYTKGGLVTPG